LHVNFQVSHLQARFDRAARILQIGHEDLETVLEKETVILNTIKEQNKDIMEEKEKLEENKAKLDKDIEALMEKVRIFFFLCVCYLGT
jgi:predicted  nucleic acid-binding Zn-ribbon protein